MAIRIQNEFYSNSGVKYKVEVHDSTWAGSVTTSLDDVGFEIDIDGSEDDLLETIKPSSCNCRLIDDGSGDFAAFRADLAQADEGQFSLVIYRWNGSSYDLYWCGKILTDTVQWRNESPTKEFSILAKDGLNRLGELQFDEINSSPFTTAEQTFIYIIKTILAKNGLASFYSGDFIKVSIDWNDTSQSISPKSRIFENIRLWGDMLQEQSNGNELASEQEPMDCLSILDGLLKLFCARIIQSEGVFHIQQVSNFVADTYTEADYDNSGAYVTNQSVTIKRSTDSDFYPLEGGVYGYIASLRSAKLTAKGYLDVRGAYIEEVELNRSNTSFTQTLNLGNILGGTYASGTYGTNAFKAEQAGTLGNSISLTFDGTSSTGSIVNAWNTANPNNIVLVTGGTNSMVQAAGSLTLTGGDGESNRNITFDFDLYSHTNNQVKASNIIITVDIKLICGSYRIKNRTGYANQGVCDWSTTSTDKWTFVKQGYSKSTDKIQLLTPEIPFAQENNCTAEVTITLTKKNSALWIDPTDPTIWPQNTWDFFSTLRNFRCIAWDKDNNTITDQEVTVENPTTNENSIEYDFGDILIGDNPLVQTSISSKNWLEVKTSLSTWKRSNVWDASFDTDYNLVTTMLMECVALRRIPTEKYIGSFEGDYDAWKSIGYDSARWVFMRGRFDSRTDIWNGTWFKINYDRDSITLSNERFLPPPNGLKPYKRPLVLINDIPVDINPKGVSVVPYIQGQGAITAIDNEALNNNKFKSGDSMMVVHPTKGDILQTFVVDSDTTISDTSISVVSQTVDTDLPVGALLIHNPIELVASEKVRTENLVLLGGEYAGLNIVLETDFLSGGGFYYYQLSENDRYSIIKTTNTGVDRVYLPLIEDGTNNNQSVIITVKCNESCLIYPHPTDTTAGAKIFTINTGAANLLVSGGNQRTFMHDGTDWHTIGF